MHCWTLSLPINVCYSTVHISSSQSSDELRCKLTSNKVSQWQLRPCNSRRRASTSSDGSLMVTWAGREPVMNASKADTEHGVTASDEALPPPRVNLELLARRRSDFVFFGLTELSDCRPVSVAARNLSTVHKWCLQTTINTYFALEFAMIYNFSTCWLTHTTLTMVS